MLGLPSGVFQIEVAELEQQAEMERGVWQQRLLATKMDIEERAAKVGGAGWEVLGKEVQ